LRNPILVPDYIAAFKAGDDQVEIAIAIHIDEADIIRRLIVVEAMLDKSPLAVVLIGGGNARVFRDGHYVRIAVRV